MSYNETLNKVQNSFINYMKYYENKYANSIRYFFSLWKLFDMYIKNKPKNPNCMISEKEIYVTDKIFNEIERVKRKKIKYKIE